MSTLIVATHNRHKTEEIAAVLGEHFDAITDLASLADLHGSDAAPEPEEDADDFEGNARIKAAAAAIAPAIERAGFDDPWILADDSGIEVDALDGQPGVYSARYAGENASDVQRFTKLLDEMKGQTNRKAAFKCVISLAVPTGAALTYEASCEGMIAEKPAGDGGFGYDPVFYYPPLKKTFGELSREEKGRISHRGKALGELKDEFDKVLTWIRQNMPAQEKFRCQDDI